MNDALKPDFLKPDSQTIPEDEFLRALSPSDLRGRVNLRMEYAIEQQLNAIAEDSRYPLNSVSEVVRYCIFHGLERLSSMKMDTVLLNQIKAANALITQDKIQCEAVEIMQRMDERMDWYIANGYYDQVIELAAKIREYFDSGSGFWQEWMRDTLDEKFMEWSDRIDRARKVRQ